jgi:hypothetical protein
MKKLILAFLILGFLTIREKTNGQNLLLDDNVHYKIGTIRVHEMSALDLVACFGGNLVTLPIIWGNGGLGGQNSSSNNGFGIGFGNGGRSGGNKGF